MVTQDQLAERLGNKPSNISTPQQHQQRTPSRLVTSGRGPGSVHQDPSSASSRYGSSSGSAAAWPNSVEAVLSVACTCLPCRDTILDLTLIQLLLARHARTPRVCSCPGGRRIVGSVGLSVGRSLSAGSLWLHVFVGRGSHRLSPSKRERGPGCLVDRPRGRQLGRQPGTVLSFVFARLGRPARSSGCLERVAPASLRTASRSVDGAPPRAAAFLRLTPAACASVPLFRPLLRPLLTEGLPALCRNVSIACSRISSATTKDSD